MKLVESSSITSIRLFFVMCIVVYALYACVCVQVHDVFLSLFLINIFKITGLFILRVNGRTTVLWWRTVKRVLSLLPPRGF